MDAHLFRRFCEALVPEILGARFEKIHQPGPGITVFTLYGDIFKKRYLVLQAERRHPFLFLATQKIPVYVPPPALVMRLRKYLSGRRISAAWALWEERCLILQIGASPETELSLASASPETDFSPASASPGTDFSLASDRSNAGPFRDSPGSETVHTGPQCLWLELNLREGARLHFSQPACLPVSALLAHALSSPALAAPAVSTPAISTPAISDSAIASAASALTDTWPHEILLAQAALLQTAQDFLQPNGQPWHSLLTPALRRTLAAIPEPEDRAALLYDLEAGGGDVFTYFPAPAQSAPALEAGAELASSAVATTSAATTFTSTTFTSTTFSGEALPEAFAWPLPPSLRRGRTEHSSDQVYAALESVGQACVFAPLAIQVRQQAAKPHNQEAKRLNTLRKKLDTEQKRLEAMCALQEKALLLQAQLYKFSPEEKAAFVDLEIVNLEVASPNMLSPNMLSPNMLSPNMVDPDMVSPSMVSPDMAALSSHANADFAPEAPRVQRMELNPRLTIRANMAAFFHQAGRGKRGLEHLTQRRLAVQNSILAAQQRALMATSSPASLGSKASKRPLPLKKFEQPGKVNKYGQPAKGGSGAGAALAPALSSRLSSGLSFGIPKEVEVFRSKDGFTLLRGRDNKGNAQVLKLAAPHDFWLHTAQGPSAHVIIRRDHPEQPVPTSTLEEAGILVAAKSWLRDQNQAEIQYSLAKYIHPMKKASPGTVRIDKSEGTFWVRWD